MTAHVVCVDPSHLPPPDQSPDPRGNTYNGPTNILAVNHSLGGKTSTSYPQPVETCIFCCECLPLPTCPHWLCGGAQVFSSSRFSSIPQRRKCLAFLSSLDVFFKFSIPSSSPPLFASRLPFPGFSSFECNYFLVVRASRPLGFRLRSCLCAHPGCECGWVKTAVEQMT